MDVLSKHGLHEYVGRILYGKNLNYGNIEIKFDRGELKEARSNGYWEVEVDARASDFDAFLFQKTELHPHGCLLVSYDLPHLPADESLADAPKIRAQFWFKDATEVGNGACSWTNDKVVIER